MNTSKKQEINKLSIVDINQENIRSKIHIIRNQQVILDHDLAEIYGYSTKAFNQQVKRNINRLDGDDFMFRLTSKDIECISRSQFVTSIVQTKGKKGGRTSLPYAFTEQGIYMLMTILRGDLAISQSRMLIRLFKSMKGYILNNQYLLTHNEALDLALKNKENIKELQSFMATKKDIDEVQKRLDIIDSNFINEDEVKSFIIESNTKFEADEFYKQLFKKVNNSIIIFDNYISSKTLKLLTNCKDKTNITLITNGKSNSKDKLKQYGYEDFIKEYSKYSIHIIDSDNRVHDRFIIIDYKTNKQRIYTSGSSLKDAGNKLSAFVELKDVSLTDELIDLIDNGKEYK